MVADELARPGGQCDEAAGTAAGAAVPGVRPLLAAVCPDPQGEPGGAAAQVGTRHVTGTAAAVSDTCNVTYLQHCV